MRGIDGAAAVSTTQQATSKNPGIATVLSFVLAGAGQFYNGDHKKGALMLIGGIVAGAMTGGLLYVAAWLWSMIDAYLVASGKAKMW